MQSLPREGLVTPLKTSSVHNVPSPELHMHTSATLLITQAGAVFVARLLHILSKHILEVLYKIWSDITGIDLLRSLVYINVCVCRKRLKGQTGLECFPKPCEHHINFPFTLTFTILIGLPACKAG